MLMKYVVVVVSLVLIEIPIKGFEHRSPISVLSILETLVHNIGERLLDNYFETYLAPVLASPLDCTTL